MRKSSHSFDLESVRNACCISCQPSWNLLVGHAGSRNRTIVLLIAIRMELRMTERMIM